MFQMGRFTWKASHSKQDSDKTLYMPNEWFNKASADPSRQALDQLKKDFEESGQISANHSPKTRSRSNTISSALSYYAKSHSSDGQTRPSSRQSIVQDPIVDGTRPENAARTFLNKGSRILRRQGSKLTFGPSSTDNGLDGNDAMYNEETSLPRRGLSHKSMNARFNLPSPRGMSARCCPQVLTDA